MRARKKKWAEPFLLAHPDLVLEKADREDGFFLSPKLYLEIGAGKGDFALQMGAKLEGGYLALERDESVSGVFAKKLVASDLKNIRIYPSDFDYVFPELQGLAFSLIFLNFSDPWPKKRHHKRRLTALDRLLEMASLLQEGGELRFKSDNLDLYEFTKEEAEKVPSLVLVEDEPNYAFDSENDAMSEYEARFRADNKPIHRLVYRKITQKEGK